MENKQHVQVPNNMTANESLTPKDLLVYAVIKKYKNRETLSCYPSLNTIVEKSGVSKPTVMNAIDKLESADYIKVGKKGRSNLYTFNPHKTFEPFSYDFLEDKTTSPEEKSFLIASQQLMFKDIEGYGKISMSDEELAKTINMSYKSLVKYQKSLQEKGYLTVIKTSAKESGTGLQINEKIYNLERLGQAIIWTLKKHEEDINELKEKTTETSKDVAILMKEVKRLNKIIENLSTTDIEGITL